MFAPGVLLLKRAELTYRVIYFQLSYSSYATAAASTCPRMVTLLSAVLLIHEYCYKQLLLVEIFQKQSLLVPTTLLSYTAGRGWLYISNSLCAISSVSVQCGNCKKTSTI